MHNEPVDYIQRTLEQYTNLGYPPYQWVNNPGDPPFVPLGKALQDARVGLVASGGIYRHGQVAFHFKDDCSFRLIPTTVKLSELRITHFAYDLTAARVDPNVIFPLETLRDMAQLSRIGELGPHAYSFMGGIYSSRKVKEILAPAIADRLVKDGVDVVILVPV